MREWRAQRLVSEGMVPRSTIFGRRETDSLKLARADSDSSALVMPGKKHELRRSTEVQKQGVVGLSQRVFLETPAREDQDVAMEVRREATPSS